MKVQVALIAAAAGLFAAAPAAADEWRLEARGGVAWAQGEEEAVAGLALGHDFDLGETAFVGFESSLDKVLASDGGIVFGNSLRAGAKLGTGKLYAAGGYSVVESGENAWHLGAGYQHKVGSQAYLKLEYRRLFANVDTNVVMAGVGAAF